MEFCQLCGNKGSITLRLNTVVEKDEIASKLLPTVNKTYPCPECQQVFYRHDLIHCNGVTPFRVDFKDNKDYMNSMRAIVARRAVDVALRNKALTFSEMKEPAYVQYGFSDLRGELVVVSPKAKGWKK